MTTEYLLHRKVEHVLAALTPVNRVIMRVCMHAGLRIGDMLAIKTEPHSARKIYAVDLLAKYGDIERVQRALNHSSQSVTLVYAMADRPAPDAEISEKAARRVNFRLTFRAACGTIRI